MMNAMTIDDKKKIQQEQQAGDRWLQQRAEFRAARHKWVREHEQLPEHDGVKYVVQGKDRNQRVGLAVGRSKGAGAGKALIDGIADAADHADTGFTVLDDNPALLASELRDLERDAALLAAHESVRYFEVAAGPTMDDVILNSHVGGNYQGVRPDSESDEDLLKWMETELRKRMERSR